MSELWAVLGDPWEDPFGCEYGPAELARHFTRVERRDARTEASWETREALQAYLDAFLELGGRLRRSRAPVSPPGNGTQLHPRRRQGVK